MKLTNKTKFDVCVASHFGMCFGVKAAIAKTKKLASHTPITILGELAHNDTVIKKLENLGAKKSNLEDHNAKTPNVIITAHGTSDTQRKKWADNGYIVTDTTCPLVHKAHNALKTLILAEYTPVLIGKPEHVEVRGLAGDFPQTQIILNIQDIDKLNIKNNKIGIISQTTQQIDHVNSLLSEIKQKYPNAKVKYIDTVCSPTKERQTALVDLCNKSEIIIVVGGKNSNNTAQLAQKCRNLGCVAYHVQSPNDIKPTWFTGYKKVGITAGTSTPDEDVENIKRKLLQIATA